MTEKKLYEKPTIKVVPVNIRSQILAGSGTDASRNGYGWGGDWDNE